jgi:hypothetical protein
MEQVARSNRQCPECGVKLTRYEWSKLWWMSSGMSGRLVQPCQECGTKLRLSSMALVSAIASLGLIIIALTYIFYPTSLLLFLALGLLLVILIAMLATRVESIPKMSPTIDERPPRLGKPPR